MLLRKCCEYSGEVMVRWLVKVLENEERRKEEEEQDALTLAAVQSRIASSEKATEDLSLKRLERPVEVRPGTRVSPVDERAVSRSAGDFAHQNSCFRVLHSSGVGLTGDR